MAIQFSEATLKKIRRAGKMLNALERISSPLAGKMAFQFFCTPRRLPIREKDAAFLATAVQDSLIFKTLKIRTYSWPASDPAAKSVLLLHGWESSSARWWKYVKHLREAGFTVQAIDAPASGNSQGKRLNAILFSGVVKEFMAKNGAPYMMVGHSLGGAAAVLSIAMLGAAAPSKIALLGVFAESTRVIQDFGAILGVNEKVIEAMHKVIEKQSGLPVHDYSVVQKVAQLKGVKGLVIHDVGDDVAPVAEGGSIAGAWGAAFLQTEGFGHRLQDKSVIKAVVDFAVQP